MRATMKDGFEVEINEKALNDWNYLKILRKIDKGEVGLIVDAAEMILGGEENVDRLADHLAIDGATPADAMIEALNEILESLNEGKN